MIITNYYRGGTDRLSGFTFDTEMKTYKEFVIPGKLWTKEYVRRDRVMVGPMDGFDNPGDLDYYFPTLTEVHMKLNDIKRLGFKEDKDMVLDFGIFEM